MAAWSSTRLTSVLMHRKLGIEPEPVMIVIDRRGSVVEAWIACDTWRALMRRDGRQ